MEEWLKRIYKNNKAIVWAAVISIVLMLGILWKVKDEVTRFTLIMPIFAGFILFSILITPDEELEDNKNNQKTGEAEVKTKSKKILKKIT